MVLRVLLCYNAAKKACMRSYTRCRLMQRFELDALTIVRAPPKPARTGKEDGTRMKVVRREREATRRPAVNIFTVFRLGGWQERSF